MTSVPLFAQNAAGDAPLNAALDAEWQYQLKVNPETATYIGDTRYNDRLNDYSPAAFAREITHAKEALQKFEAIDSQSLSDDGRLNRTLMIRSLQRKNALIIFE